MTAPTTSATLKLTLDQRPHPDVTMLSRPYPSYSELNRLIPRRNGNSVSRSRGMDPVLQQKCIQRSLRSDPTQPRPTIGRGFFRIDDRNSGCLGDLVARAAFLE